ncbi:MAG TPA: spore coat protein U domain-containing protein [Candidatus Methanoperedens sp.]|nr:spore coat protein U domain-containing protein [Candidatus Methanoperedens sp.]
MEMTTHSKCPGPLAAGLLAAAILLLPGNGFPAATGPLAVGVAAAGNCRFHGATTTLNFGSIDPLAGRDVTATASLSFKCTKGATWNAADDGGLHAPAGGGYRLRHVALDAYIPYRLSYSNAAGTSQGANIEQTLTIDGLIRGATYATAPAGGYADTVTITLGP